MSNPEPGQPLDPANGRPEIPGYYSPATSAGLASATVSSSSPPMSRQPGVTPET